MNQETEEQSFTSQTAQNKTHNRTLSLHGQKCQNRLSPQIRTSKDLLRALFLILVLFHYFFSVMVPFRRPHVSVQNYDTVLYHIRQKVMTTSLATTSSGRPSLSFSSTYGFSCTLTHRQRHRQTDITVTSSHSRLLQLLASVFINHTSLHLIETSALHSPIHGLLTD